MSQTAQSFVSIVEMVERVAEQRPDADAVILPRRRGDQYDYERRSFRTLRDDVGDIAAGLVSCIGIQPGMKIVLMVPHGYEFIAVTFAILKTGATLVLIDPGMGKRSVLRCLESIKPDGFVAVPIVDWVRRFAAQRFPKARHNVIVGRSVLSSTQSLERVRQAGRNSDCQCLPTANSDAAIIFTSGSTGPAKGVLFSHTNFVAQAEQIRDFYGIDSGGCDLAAFPLFGLFNAAMGTTTVVPDMNAARPATVNPRRFVQHIHDLQITQSFASPAVWNVLGRYCEEQKVKMPSLQRVLVAGAPVPPRTLQWITESMSAVGEMHTPYGATEALPVASISAREVLAETAQLTAKGGGICVGQRFPAVQWKIIEITDDAIEDIADVRQCPLGTIGELIVDGPQVTQRYVTSDRANAESKIKDGSSDWHRMGDVGYLDEQQRFWFCGRKAHRVVTSEGTLFSVQVESLFHGHPQIYRVALVGIGIRPQQLPVMICEPWPGRWPRGHQARQALRQSLLEIAHSNTLTASLCLDQIRLKKRLPVDTRHNSKIFREQLVPWATQQLRNM